MMIKNKLKVYDNHATYEFSGKGGQIVRYEVAIRENKEEEDSVEETETESYSKENGDEK